MLGSTLGRSDLFGGGRPAPWPASTVAVQP